MSGRTAMWSASLAEGGVLSGISKSTPIILGYIPVGFAFGILALEAGLSAANTILMSAMVLGAASQLVAVGQIVAGVPAPTVVATTFIVNLRHMLMSSALAPHLKGWPGGEDRPVRLWADRRGVRAARRPDDARPAGTGGGR